MTSGVSQVVGNCIAPPARSSNERVPKSDNLTEITWGKKGSKETQSTVIFPTAGKKFAYKTIKVREDESIVLCPNASVTLKSETGFFWDKTLEARDALGKKTIFTLALKTFSTNFNCKFDVPEERKGSYRFCLISGTGASWLSTNLFQFEDFFNDEVKRLSKTLPKVQASQIENIQFDRCPSVECDFKNPIAPDNSKKMVVYSSSGCLWIKDGKPLLQANKEFWVVIEDISIDEAKQLQLFFKDSNDPSFINEPKKKVQTASDDAFVVRTFVPLLYSDALLLCIKIGSTVYETRVFLYNSIVSDTQETNPPTISTKKLKVDFSTTTSEFSARTTLLSTHKDGNETRSVYETTGSQDDVTATVPVEVDSAAPQSTGLNKGPLDFF